VNSSSPKTVVVGLSGGVDSSLSAYLLKAQGFNVIGMFMKNWEEKDGDGVCLSSKEYEDVLTVCDHLKIPCYSVNFVKEYWEGVFSQFLEGFKQGHTPNPDILCNREIKFKAMFEKALELGGDFLATGHYCQTNPSSDLLRGIDPGKDQSYFLYTLKSSILEKVLFPVGHLLKNEVRALARKAGISTSEKKDSTGICFIGERNFKQFLSKYIAITPGNFETLQGKVVGRHDGVAYYTIGQRKGMGIGGAGEAWYVVDKDISRNVVFVEQGPTHSALYCDTLIASDITWVNNCPPSFPFKCHSKIRYRQKDQECLIEKFEDGKAHVRFPIPQRAVTLRQSIVFYDQEFCLGGGVIDSRGPSYYERGLSLPKEISN
jgi:tRNA-specific 2-thiouridylase